ncbi:MAG: sigma-54-dependent Fis family transcriptional regulator [Bacteroidales bacterium]|nr:sigma-54-dependent Fis family transcriptional regulator [Bacteroidales bacterium]MBR6309861.1 sigma-54-dependent Fis family transcriptional regulator [Paludibacteraceae bacterium]MDD6357878.1 sigma-54 dependent transcriptional regulator [Bacteroidales bacterium]
MPKVDIQSIKQRFGIIGNSELLNRCIDIAVQVASTDLSVLVTGESGVGKENFPQIIHQYSYRKHGPYIAVNCGAIPEGTIDSELFGHEKGSFTGALSDRKGYFEVANEGTIFLDEVGELPLSTQARLLRVLESGEFIKVGSSKVQKTNVRVVAATNLNMQQAVRDGRFREDLYYRLNTINIQVPSLRERREDIPVLFRKFAADFAQRYNMPTVRLTPEAQDLLQDYYFHGNIRQLKNIAEQISVIEQSREISVDILKNYLPDNEVRKMPVLFGGHEQESRSFNNEREILYQVLFDMKKDMDELRKVVHDLMNRNVKYQQMPQDANVQYIPNVPMTEATPVAHPVVAISEYPKKEDPSTRDNAHIEDTEEYVEETLSLEDMEKDVIKKALEKHRGKRKEAANELKISERTLYRKIKEYGIEC